MGLRVLHDRVLVKRSQSTTETKSGIIIPDMAQEKPAEGKVVGVGSSCKESLKIGDQVLFGKYAGQDIKVDGDDLLILKEEEIIGVVE